MYCNIKVSIYIVIKKTVSKIDNFVIYAQKYLNYSKNRLKNLK